MDYASDELAKQIKAYILPTVERLESHISTDKVIYRPGDLVFIEVLLLNAMNKTPVALNQVA